MIRNIKFTLSLLFAIVAFGDLKAQVEPHFSQYFAYPLWLNPALAGGFDGDVRVTAIHRRQWSGLMTPFSTYGLSADMVAGKNINLGANIMNQTAGNAGSNYMNGHISASYTGVRFGKDNSQQLNFSLQAGMISRKFDPSKFQFGDQWTAGNGWDPTNPGGEAIANTSSTVLDMGAGFAWFDGAADKKMNFFAGFSAGHLTRPEDPFVTGETVSRIPVRYTLHGGVRINANENLALYPNVIFMKQGTAQEIMLGGYAQINAGEDIDLLGGVNYRFDVAISPYAGFTY